MEIRVSEWLHRVSQGWVVLGALALFALFVAFVLPGQSSRAAMDSAGAGSPDMSILYSPSDLYRMAEAYGEAGRRAYVRARFTFDLVWPLAYLAFLATAISWVSRQAWPADSLGRRANLAPVLGALFDYLENVSTSVVMLRYPARTPGSEWLAPLFTLVKWVFVYGSFALLLVALAAWLWCRARSRGRGAQGT